WRLGFGPYPCTERGEMIVAAPRTVRRPPEPRRMPQAARQPRKLLRGLKKGPMPMARDAFHVTLLVLVTLNISRLPMQFPRLKAMRPELLLTIACLGWAFAKPAFLSKRPIFATWPARGMALFGI